MRVEVRNDKVVIDGYVNAVERFSKPLYDKKGKFIERIMPTVFRRAIEKNDAIKVLLNHDYDVELANTKDGSANLYEDNIGLRAIVEITEPTVIEKAKKKKLRGWSFGFSCNKEEEIVNDDGVRERTVRDINLIEVSILDDRKTPAYIGTSIEMRDDDVTFVEYRNEEFEEDSFSYEETETEKEKPDFESMTASQKREILSSAYRQIFVNGWLDDYDNNFVYGTTKEDNTLFRMPYTIVDGTVNIDTNNQVKVVRGGYKEVREDNQVPEQSQNVNVEKIDYSKYEKMLDEIRRK